MAWINRYFTGKRDVPIKFISGDQAEEYEEDRSVSSVEIKSKNRFE